jgi:glycosyltransferase involved in cell wall biosynthesis
MPCSVHITTVHPPFDVRVFHKEAKTLVNAGFDVAVIAQHDKNETVDGIEIVALPKAKNRIHRMLSLPLKAFILALKQKAHIYHLHDPELMPVGVLLKLIKGKKIIYDVHEDYGKQTLSKSYIPKIARKDVAILIRIVEYLSSKLFDAVITATDDILKNFSYHKIATSIKNFPIASSFSVRTEDRKDDDKDIFRLIYVGVLAQIRGITEIIRALELINSNCQLKLTLCGKCFPSQYEHEIRALAGFKKVEYLGWVEPQGIPRLLEKHDAGVVFLHPIINYVTSLPLKLFEYMAAGLPVIVSNFSLWKEIVEKNGCGICVDPLKPEEIAKAIIYLMDRPWLRKEMGEKGRRAVLEMYNWENEGTKLLDLYGELLRK